MKKAICALLVLAMATGSLGLWVPAMVVLFPLALTAFTADVPIYLVTRKQPLTNGLMQVELIDGYNPITGQHSSDEADQHSVDVTDSY
jgi:hypothetical protein